MGVHTALTDSIMISNPKDSCGQTAWFKRHCGQIALSTGHCGQMAWSARHCGHMAWGGIAYCPHRQNDNFQGKGGL